MPTAPIVTRALSKTASYGFADPLGMGCGKAVNAHVNLAQTVDCEVLCLHPILSGSR